MAHAARPEAIMLSKRSGLDLEISEGIMAVGTAALGMLLLATVCFGTWSVLQYLLSKSSAVDRE